MKLLLIRHAQSVGNAEGRIQGQFDSPLSELGREQARLLAARLKRQGWCPAGLYASDLRRAAETADIVAAVLGVPVIPDARLREYDIGLVSGSVWTDLETLFPEVWRRIHHGDGPVDYPGEEGLESLHARTAAVLAEIRERHSQDEMAGIVSHGGSLGMLLAHLLGVPIRRPLPFVFDNASVSMVDFRPRGPRLALLNDTSHLDGQI